MVFVSHFASFAFLYPYFCFYFSFQLMFWADVETMLTSLLTLSSMCVCVCVCVSAATDIVCKKVADFSFAL